MSSKRINIMTAQEPLYALLVAINALEGWDPSADKDRLPGAVRQVLYDLKNVIAEQKAYQTNSGLASLDRVFTKAGWDHQGLRWTREDPKDRDEPEQVFIVEFTNTARTVWTFADVPRAKRKKVHHA